MSTLLDMIKKEQSVRDSVVDTMTGYLNNTFTAELNDELRKCSMTFVKSVCYHPSNPNPFVGVGICERNIDPLTCNVINQTEYVIDFILRVSIGEFELYNWTGGDKDHFKVNDFIIDKLNKRLTA